MTMRRNVLATMVALLLPSLLIAQQGKFVPFGLGCPSSRGPQPGCLTANWKNYPQNWRGETGTQRYYAIQVKNNTFANKKICAIELYGASTRGFQILQVWIYSTTARGPGVILSATTMPWNSTPDWYRASFQIPVTVKPNGSFFLVFENPGKLPLQKKPGESVSYFSRQSTKKSWSGAATDAWMYSIFCCGEVPPLWLTHGAIGVPSLTKPYTITLQGTVPNSFCLFFYGFSKKFLGNTTILLPLRLAQIGAPGCLLYISPDEQFSFLSDARGERRFQLSIPNQKWLIGKHFYSQWLVSDSNANQLGLVVSNAADNLIGA